MELSNANDIEGELPPVDERLVAPGSRYEIYDGELVHVPHADEARGPRLSKLAALLEAHTGSEFDVARRMLTRTSETSDIAADVSVFPFAPDPRTGGCQIEQLAFDVVHTESLDHSGRKAVKLVARGVRRVFAVDVDRGCVLEWTDAATWRELDSNSSIEDPALAVPLPIKPLVHDAKVDDAIARALLLKRSPVVEAALAQAMAKGIRDGLVEARRHRLLRVLAARGVSPGPHGSSPDPR